MQIVGFALENFRSYKSQQSVSSLPFISSFIGPNNAGKSNIIKALLWYREIGRLRINSGSPRQSEIKKLFNTGCRNSPLKIDVEFELDESDRAYLLNLLPYKNQDIGKSIQKTQLLKRIKHSLSFSYANILLSETVLITNFFGSWLDIYLYKNNEQYSNNLAQISKIDNNNYQELDSKLQKIPSGSFGMGQPFGWCILNSTQNVQDTIGNFILEYLSKWFWISPTRYADKYLEPREDLEIEPTGQNLIRVINDYYGKTPEKAMLVMKEVYKIIPDIKEITAPMHEKKVIGIIEETSNVKIEIDEVGTGLVQTLIIIISILTRPHNSLFMIEEPELHLHAFAQRSLFKLIKAISNDRKSKFVINTHSTIFSEITDQTKTYLVHKHDGISKIRLLEDRPHLLTVKQLLGHENADLFGYNAVIIIEGSTEEKVIPPLSLSLGIDWTKLAAKILNLGGSGNTTRIKQLVEFLKGSDTMIFFIVDDHTENRSKLDELAKMGHVKKDRVFYLDRGFEDSFNNSTLLSAITELAKEKGIDNLKVSEQDLQQARLEQKSISHVIKKLFYLQTEQELSKPELGLKIVEIVTKQETREHTPLEKYLKKIEDMMKENDLSQ